MFYVFSVILVFLEYYFHLEERAELRDEESACGRRSSEATSREGVGDITGQERCKEAPVCKEPPAAQAQGVRHQSKSRRRG